MSHRPNRLARRLCRAITALCLATGASAVAEHAAAEPTATELIHTLQGREFTDAVRAAEHLGRYASQRAQVVPALIDALRNREWATCSGDVRDAIARSLAELKATEAVVPLLALVRSGASLEHECVE